MTEQTSPADEIKALTRIVAILDKIDPAAQQRVVDWMGDRYPVEEQRGLEL